MILSIGTQVVSRGPIAGGRHAYPGGTLAVVIEAPADAEHAYRVRLPDGYETSLTRDQFVLRSTLEENELSARAAALEDHELEGHVILRTVVGSRAYGLEHEGSDIDTRGIYLAPPHRLWSLYGVPEQLENRETDEVYWELKKFLVLALGANPNLLEVLHSPLVVEATPIARELLELRGAFLSKLVYTRYNGYVMSQFRKLSQRLDAGRAPNWKHAMHMIRLLLSGIEALEQGEIAVRVAAPHRASLLEIRDGEWSFEALDRWRVSLHRRMEDAYRATHLPERPDYEAVNDYLLRARRSSLPDPS